MSPKWTQKVVSPWKAIRGWRDSDAGQSLVEFSLVLPIFLVLLFALVDFGRGFYTWLLVTNAAREGARAGAVQLDNSGIDGKIRSSICSTYPTNCSLDTTKMTVTKTNVQGPRGQEMTVDIVFSFQFVTPIGSLMSLIGGSSISSPVISAHSGMRLE
jgi:Flp pilus assembly protein TadG